MIEDAAWLHGLLANNPTPSIEAWKGDDAGKAHDWVRRSSVLRQREWTRFDVVPSSKPLTVPHQREHSFV